MEQQFYDRNGREVVIGDTLLWTTAAGLEVRAVVVDRGVSHGYPALYVVHPGTGAGDAPLYAHQVAQLESEAAR